MTAARRCAFLTSKERDNESGLDYFLARYYSSAQGRFTSADEPLVGQYEDDPQTWNLFMYARNNPLLYIDPTGKDYIVFDKDGNEKRITDAQLGDYELISGTGNTALFRDKNGVEWRGTFDDAPVDDPFNVQGGPLTIEEHVSLFESFGPSLNWIIENIDENGTVPDETQSPLSRLLFGQRRIPYDQVVTTNYVQWVTLQATLNGPSVGAVGGARAWIARDLYKQLPKLVGSGNTAKFAAALSKGIVGPVGESGIKRLASSVGKYTHELKIGGSADRLLGYANEKGVIIFDKLVKGGLH